MNKHQRPIRAFVDGFFPNKHGNHLDTKTQEVGGIGIHFPDRDFNDVCLTFFGTPTKERAELTALIRAIECVRDGDNKRSVHVYTDSRYVIDVCAKYILRWKSNEWKTKNGEDVPYSDLLKYLAPLLKGVRLHHVNTRIGDVDEISMANLYAKKLACRAIKSHFARPRIAQNEAFKELVPVA